MPKRSKRQATKMTDADNKKKQKLSSSVNGNTSSNQKGEKDIKDGSKKTSSYSHWLVKSEPNSRFEKGIDVKFSFEDLRLSPNQTACWDGVRNYQARNFLRDQMKNGHDVFFYHSNCKEPGIIGICKVVKESYPDHTQFDSKDPHYDSSSAKEKPKWFMVDVQYVRPLKRFISLAELKRVYQDHSAKGGPLRNISLFTSARLSVQPISQEEWDYILKMEEESE